MNYLIWVATSILVVLLLEVTYLTVMKLKQRSLKVARGSILLDTCSIMDGRIIDIAKTGIITAELIIPRSVIRELQLLADKSDHEKRVRARKGLDNVRELQKLDTVSVTIVNDGLVDQGGVDERLLNLAQKYDASIATTDYNLNKVAKVINITVINVNELAQMLRAQHFPGDMVEIELIQPGANREQAVGYLDDGTMVVVEDSRNLIGQKVKVEIVRSLQTEAGRMMFAKRVSVVHNNTNNKSNNTVTKRPRAQRISKTVTSKIKSAPAFHSDQLKQMNDQQTDNKANKVKAKSTQDHNGNNSNKVEKTSKSARKPVEKRASNASAHCRTATAPVRRKSSKSAEADMVRLANMTASDK